MHSSISAALRLRMTGVVDETQKVQPTRQPSWVGMLRMRRPDTWMSSAPVA
jgi:hypothetical protein